MPEAFQLVPVGQLMPDPTQPRKSFDPEAIKRLAASMAARGVLMPLRVLWDEERGKFLVVAGESRLRAAVLAKLEVVPCVVVEGKPDESDLLADRICENSVRTDLPALDFSHAIRRLKKLKGCSSTALAAELGLSNAAITRAEALLNLPEKLQALVGKEKGLSESAAYAISRLETPEQQFELAERATAEGWSRSVVEEAVQAALPARKPSSSGGGSKLALKLAGGLAVNFSGERHLKWPDLLAALERMQAVAKQLADSNKPVSEWSKALKTG